MATMLNPNAIKKGRITKEMIDASVLDAKQDVIDDLVNISNDGVYFVDNQGYIILSITDEGIKTINVPSFESTTDTEYDINI